MHDAIHSLLQRKALNSDFSGVCLVTRGEEEIVHVAYGLAHHGFGIPNTTGTRFDIASVTKVFTAAAVMQLVDRGEFALDTRVMPFLGMTGTKISDDVTVFHCLTHTSGIADDADEEAGEEYEALFRDTPNHSIRETCDFLPQFAYKEPNFCSRQGCPLQQLRLRAPRAGDRERLGHDVPRLRRAAHLRTGGDDRGGLLCDGRHVPEFRRALQARRARGWFGRVA
jgi:hypothetical protein